MTLVFRFNILKKIFYCHMDHPMPKWFNPLCIFQNILYACIKLFLCINSNYIPNIFQIQGGCILILLWLSVPTFKKTFNNFFSRL